MTNDEMQTLGQLMLGMSTFLLLACALFTWNWLGTADWSSPLTSGWRDDGDQKPKHMANPWTTTVRAIEIESESLRAWREPRFVPSWDVLETVGMTRALAKIEEMAESWLAEILAERDGVLATA